METIGWSVIPDTGSHVPVNLHLQCGSMENVSAESPVGVELRQKFQQVPTIGR
jgi:hypothetical protein